MNPIDEYAFLSDCNGSALVHRSGRIDWMCLPRFDSPAVFAGLLDEHGGHFTIRPCEDFDVTRRYIDDSLVLETTFTTKSAQAVSVDALAVGPNDTGHDLGAHPPHALLRTIRCTRGDVDVDIEYAPRPEYGLAVPRLHADGRTILARGGGSVLLLSSSADLEVDGSTARRTISLSEGDQLSFALEHRKSAESVPQPWTPEAVEQRLQETLHGWQSWSDKHQAYQGPWSKEVHHSARVLQGLTYFPTGAVVAAPTTSLPETPGGERNWDYRFSWIRDASLTLEALWVGACPDEAYKFFDFLAVTALEQPQLEQPHEKRHMQIMYGIGGEYDLSERTLDHLSGWQDSSPVRVGNAAWRQSQLDVYGELLAAADRLRDQLSELDVSTRHFLAEVADIASRRWTEPDHGIWEIRAEPRHYLYSKLMCWVALDRAMRISDLLDASDEHVERWSTQRDKICQSILQRGWSENLGAYGRSYSEDVLDASNLMMPIVGFISADDPRMLATIDAIEDQLTDHRGLVYRYRAEDGLSGDEGPFLLCTFWLAHARALAGQLDRATAIFEHARSFANDVGLFSEEVAPDSNQLLGNFPQAFSHIGLINAAWTIHTQRNEAKNNH